MSMDEWRCPICKKRLSAVEARESEHAPFCSERCRMVDLGRWLNEDYRIAGRSGSEERSEKEDES